MPCTNSEKSVLNKCIHKFQQTSLSVYIKKGLQSKDNEKHTIQTKLSCGDVHSVTPISNALLYNLIDRPIILCISVFNEFTGIHTHANYRKYFHKYLWLPIKTNKISIPILLYSNTTRLLSLNAGNLFG